MYMYIYYIYIYIRVYIIYNTPEKGPSMKGSNTKPTPFSFGDPIWLFFSDLLRRPRINVQHALKHQEAHNLRWNPRRAHNRNGNPSFHVGHRSMANHDISLEKTMDSLANHLTYAIVGQWGRCKRENLPKAFLMNGLCIDKLIDSF